MTDDRMNLSLITGILDVLDRHGYTRGDDEHTGRAIVLTSDLAHITKAPSTTRSAPISTRHRRRGPNRRRPNQLATTSSRSRLARSRPSCPPWT